MFGRCTKGPDSVVQGGQQPDTRIYLLHTCSCLAHTMPGLLPEVDPNGLLEYSVVYTDRSINHMSAKFGDVMRSIGGMLKEVYAAPTAVVIPGSGTYGMEAVARQFANGKRTVVVRNGWFSFRWTQIFEAGKIPASSTVLKARRADPADPQGAFSPAPVEEVSFGPCQLHPFSCLLRQGCAAGMQEYPSACALWSVVITDSCVSVLRKFTENHRAPQK